MKLTWSIIVVLLQRFWHASFKKIENKMTNFYPNRSKFLQKKNFLQRAQVKGNLVCGGST